MVAILQTALPPEMETPRPLPGIAPCEAADWLRVDDAYAGQMARKAALLADQREAVLWQEQRDQASAVEVLEEALALLPGLGFTCAGDVVGCPDGREVRVDRDNPLATLGHLVQEDICLLEKRGDQHVLTGAVLCFPASWRLAEKAGRPLTAIHDPVAEYDGDLARRVQRLFDGVQVGRPLWRFNRLWYVDPELHQPRSEIAPRRADPGDAPGAYLRSERQCVVRLPQTRTVVFSIHTYVVAG